MRLLLGPMWVDAKFLAPLESTSWTRNTPVRRLSAAIQRGIGTGEPGAGPDPRPGARNGRNFERRLRRSETHREMET
ncbi:hypothetical protein MYIN104542_09635 [Mycobacterium intermedium]